MKENCYNDGEEDIMEINEMDIFENSKKSTEKKIER